MSVIEAVRMVPCGQCWQKPGLPCTITGPSGDHVARYQRAETRGLITRNDLAAAVTGLEVIAGHVIVTAATGEARAA